VITQEFLNFLDEQIELLITLRRFEVESGRGSLTKETTDESLKILDETGQKLVRFARSDSPSLPFEE